MGYLYNNPNLTGINNLYIHNSCTVFNLSNTGLNFDFTNFPAISHLLINTNNAQTVIDISGRNVTTTIISNTFIIHTCGSLTSIIFPSNAANSVFQNTVAIYNNAVLTTLSNLDLISMTQTNSGRYFDVYNNASLNITFPFGANSFTPHAIQIQNNAMNVTNVDATIDSIYTNKTKWIYSPKSLNISGAGNAAPSGTYQAPAGFVLGVSDGTPASAKEKVYVLVNNYSWTITMN
jgi:hypothetical protein